MDEPTHGSGFDWIIGQWRNDKKTGAFESWEKSSNHLYQGEGFVMNGKEKVVKEKMRVEFINEKYFYIAEIPDTSLSVTFEITHQEESGFICESEEINFPQRITYELKGYDTLVTTLEGQGRTLFFEFTKEN